MHVEIALPNREGRQRILEIHAKRLQERAARREAELRRRQQQELAAAKKQDPAAAGRLEREHRAQLEDLTEAVRKEAAEAERDVDGQARLGQAALRAEEASELAEKLAANQDTILQDLIDCQGSAVDIGGYYRPDSAKTEAAMRPSKTLNDIIGKDF